LVSVVRKEERWREGCAIGQRFSWLEEYMLSATRCLYKAATERVVTMVGLKQEPNAKEVNKQRFIVAASHKLDTF